MQAKGGAEPFALSSCFNYQSCQTFRIVATAAAITATFSIISSISIGFTSPQFDNRILSLFIEYVN